MHIRSTRTAVMLMAVLLVATAASAQHVSAVRARAKSYARSGELGPLVAFLDSLDNKGEPDRARLIELYRAEVLRQEGRMDEALAAMSAMDADRIGEHPVVRLSHAELRSYVLNTAGLKPNALEEAKSAAHIAEMMGDTVEILDMGIWLAQLEGETGNESAALKRLVALERLAERTQAGGLHCEIILNVGNVHYRSHQLIEAVRAYQRSIECARASGNSGIVADAKFNLAACQFESDSTDEAIASYRSLLRDLEPERDQQFASDVHAHIGLVLHRKRDDEGALRELHTALDLLQGSGIKQGQEACHLYMSEAQIGLGQFDKALESAEAALSSSREQGLLERMIESEQRMAEIHDLRGDHKAAYTHLQLAAHYSDSLALSRYDQESNTLKVAYETEKKDREIAKKKEEARVRNIQLIAALVATVLLVLSTAVLIRNLLHRKRLAAQEREIYEQRMGDVMRQSEIRSLDAVMQGQEMERKRVAQDLHDRLGSMLSAIKLQFNALEGKLERTRDENQQQYRHVTGMLDDAVGEVRRISHNMLKSSLAQFGLKGALDDLAQALSAPGKLEVEMSLFGLEERMDQKVEIAVFRMVQECVGNALKHAKADAISIEVTRTTAALNVMVSDNGKGFDPAKVNEGMGLGNLRQRAAEVKGSVVFDSTPGRGTTVTIDVPLL